MSMEKNVAEALGMALPPEDSISLVSNVIQPHEIVQVDNPELPTLVDLEQKIVEADRQREELILADLQVHAIEGDHAAAVAFAQPAHADGRCGAVVLNGGNRCLLSWAIGHSACCTTSLPGRQ